MCLCCMSVCSVVFSWFGIYGSYSCVVLGSYVCVIGLGMIWSLCDVRCVACVVLVYRGGCGFVMFGYVMARCVLCVALNVMLGVRCAV